VVCKEGSSSILKQCAFREGIHWGSFYIKEGCARYNIKPKIPGSFGFEGGIEVGLGLNIRKGLG
jgi:hypothetical protein